MSMVGFPLLLIPLAIYNIIAFLMPEVAFSTPLLKLMLMSGVEWQVTLSDVLVAVGIFLLMFEVIKGARPGAKYLTDHLLSLIVFGAAAAEFVLWPKFGTSTYFLLTSLALVDFLSGLALRTRRRGAVAAPAVSAKGTRKPEPQVEPPWPSRSLNLRRHRRQRRLRHRSLNQCCWITRNRRPRLLSRPMRPRRKSPRRGYSRVAVRHRPRTSRRADRSSDQISCSDDLPGPPCHAAAFLRVCAIGRLRILDRGTSHAARLWGLVGGRDQLSQKGRVGSRHGRFPRPVHRLGHRHERDTGRRVGVGDVYVQNIF